MWRRINERVGAAVHEETLRAAVIAAATAFAAGGATAFISGAWQKVLLAVAGLAAVSFFAVLLSAARLHDRELAEVSFDAARNENAAERKSASHERDQRAHIGEATTRPCDPGRHLAELKGLLERCRQYITGGRAEPIDLLLVSDATPHASKVVAEAGRFDHSLFDKPRELFEWLQDLTAKGRAHSALLPGLGEEYRLVGMTDSSLDEHDRTEIERAALQAHSLLLAQRVATFEQRLAG